MRKVKIGNVKGIPGPKGDPGEGQRGKKGQRGNRIVFGTAITGTSKEEMSYPTGIVDSIQNDMYWNEETCNIYACTFPGDEATAKWTYIGNSKGKETVIENSLSSKNTVNALSANCGNRLLNNIADGDTNPAEIHFGNLEGVKLFRFRLTLGEPTALVFTDKSGIQYMSGIISQDPLKDEEILLKTSDLGIPDTANLWRVVSAGGRIRRMKAEGESEEILFESEPVEQKIFKMERDLDDLGKITTENTQKIDEKPNFYNGTGEPSPDLGKDGDIYLKIEG